MAKHVNVEMVINTAPYPHTLKDLVSRVGYKQWTFELVHHDGSLCVDIITRGTTDSYDPSNTHYGVHHYMQVPPATYNEKGWRRWLFDQCLLVEVHEGMEFFKIDGKRPFAPIHAPGHNPYTINERSTDKDVRTMYTGEVNPSSKLRKLLYEEVSKYVGSILPDEEKQELASALAKAIAPEVE